MFRSVTQSVFTGLNTREERATQREKSRDLQKVPLKSSAESMQVKKLPEAMEKNHLNGSERTIQGVHKRQEIILFSWVKVENLHKSWALGRIFRKIILQ